MRQNELNRAVARATGETVSTIKHLGFLLADVPTETEGEADPGIEAALESPVIDWDAHCVTQRVAVAGGRRGRVPACC